MIILLLPLLLHAQDLYKTPKSSYKVNEDKVNDCYLKDGINASVPEKQICAVYTALLTGKKVLGCTDEGDINKNSSRTPLGGFQDPYFIRPIKTPNGTRLMRGQSLNYKKVVRIPQDNIFPLPEEIRSKSDEAEEKEQKIYSLNQLHNELSRCVQMNNEAKIISRLKGRTKDKRSGKFLESYGISSEEAVDKCRLTKVLFEKMKKEVKK